MNKQIENNILSGKYNEVKEICKKIPREKLSNIIMNIAYDTKSMSIYEFTRYMSENMGKVYWLKLSIDLLINPLCFIEGAYSK